MQERDYGQNPRDAESEASPTYEPPAIAELGTLADFTLANHAGGADVLAQMS
jgi:hypothetical protein